VRVKRRRQNGAPEGLVLPEDRYVLWREDDVLADTSGIILVAVGIDGATRVDAIEHGENPIFCVHAHATTVKLDVNENLRPVTDCNTGRIDGIVATIMALGRAMLAPQFQSVSQTRGVWTVEW